LNLLIAPLSFSNGAVGILKLAKATCDTHLRLPGARLLEPQRPKGSQALEGRKQKQIIS
jgi:hypothetical protein